MSALTTAQAQGIDITDEQIILTCDNVIAATTETIGLASGTGMLALLENPDQWRSLAAEAVSLHSAADEFLRWSAPATHNLRTAVADTELAGTKIMAGDPVVVWLPALNRDPTVFHDPHRFDLNRKPNRHLAFGAGVHFCLGAALSRLIIRTLLRELVTHVAEFKLAGPPTRLPSYILGGLTSLPLSVRAR